MRFRLVFEQEAVIALEQSNYRFILGIEVAAELATFSRDCITVKGTSNGAR